MNKPKGRWELKDADGNTVTDAELRERIMPYLAKHPNSNAHDLMPVKRNGLRSAKNPEGWESNHLSLIYPHSRVRWMAQQRRIQKALSHLERRGEVRADQDASKMPKHFEFPRYTVTTKGAKAKKDASPAA